MVSKREQMAWDLVDAALNLLIVAENKKVSPSINTPYVSVCASCGRHKEVLAHLKFRREELLSGT